MNQTWHDFLTSQQAAVSEYNEITFPHSDNNSKAVFPLTYLAVLKVSGNDAEQFLQGQVACNIKELNGNNSFFSGFCNAKGRVISTLLILKQTDYFLLVLPDSLIDKVKTKLQMYVLRSKVQLENVSKIYGLIGLTGDQEQAEALALPKSRFNYLQNCVKLSERHYLIISDVAESINIWQKLVKQGFKPQNSQLGRYLDLTAGLAWLDLASSEQYIPQMLNLDKLGGVSFTKGCYTGQEVVARTHYLGQVKRELFLAECEQQAVLNNETSVVDETGQTVGQVLSFLPDSSGFKLLVVMQTGAVELKELRLNDPQQTRIAL